MAIPLYDSNFFPDYPGQTWRQREEFITIRNPWETAGDVTAPMAGANVLQAYTIGWRRLTDDAAAAVMRAQDFMGGGSDGLYFLEWPQSAKLNLVIGTGTGAGDVSFDLQCRLAGDSAIAAGLVVTKNFTPVAYSLVTDDGNRYRQHKVTILAADNTLGATYRATWAAARRRRRVRCLEQYKLTDNGGPSKQWTGIAELIETEAGG